MSEGEIGNLRSEASIADERVGQVVALTLRLQAAIERERALLNARRPRDLGSALTEKEALANHYVREMRELAKDGQWLAAASPEAREAFQNALNGLRALLADYARMLVARRTIVEGLVQALGQEVTRQRQPFAGYGAARPAQSTRAAAIACDQTA